MDLFLLKKFVGAMLMPIPLISALLLIGLFALFTQRQRLAKWSLSLGVFSLLLLSLPWFPNAMLSDYERQYRQFDMASNIDAIVVLGCGHANDAALPITAQLYPCSTIRVLEAFRIHQYHPEATIYTSGSNIGGEAFTNAEMHKRMLVMLGVDESKIQMALTPRDTDDEVNALKASLGARPFALVTSASHMPRSMTLFKNAGTHPIAAPTEHLVREHADSNFWWSFPGTGNLVKSQRWWYETLGQAWIEIVSWWRE